jgi:hypothetical protein
MVNKVNIYLAIFQKCYVPTRKGFFTVKNFHAGSKTELKNNGIYAKNVVHEGMIG